ncbi:MAG: hypothetical protein COT73_03560 [Bdellovibrio sp. CG10_big_fil_rev_8_21_14_0_10_47_8]|nr:MAG: hypothetical protein COT73_03560 [Bdellovibrio sp. CG10_big_fil_rev_8_21_14_0_10_47_8]
MIVGLTVAVSMTSIGSWAQMSASSSVNSPLSSPAGLPANSLLQPFNQLRFANRAQCAVESELPTTSIFAIIDGYNAGRLSAGIAKSLGLPVDSLVTSGMQDFRLAVSGVQSQILEKMLRGKLPLLPADLSEGLPTNLKNYKTRALACGENVFCADLQRYLATVWAQSHKSTREIVAALQPIDGFTANNFISDKLGGKASCLYLKKFSPFQAPLQAAELQASELNQLAEVALHPETVVTSCQDQSPELDSRNAALQIDVHVADEKLWNQIGFDFWNSYKIYLSWALRYSSDLQGWTPKFAQVFRSLDFEESLVFMPNGCRAMTVPRCDNQTLAMNAIRELAKKSGTGTEFDDLIPKGAENNLVERGARAVNNDFLGTGSYDQASDWVANFRKNFVETRWIMKNKVFNANQTMTVIARTYSPENLVENIEPLLLSGAVDQSTRDEAAYLCLEWRLSSDKRLDFLRSDIDRVAQLESMLQIKSQVGLTIAEQVTYFQKLSEALRPLCTDLEQSDFFRREGYQTNWSGLEPWAKELTKTSLPQDQNSSSPVFSPLRPVAGPALVLGNPEVLICANAMDCARKIFKAAVDLYAASTYAEAFLPISSTAASADVFNPYAELKACKVYDPWFAKNRVRKIFVADLFNTALVGWNSIPLYLDVDFRAPKVTSFNQLMSDGKLKYDPNIQKSKMTKTLIADFGPLLGAPCAIQLSPHADTPFNFYAFQGISLNYCKAKAERGGVVNRPGDIASADPTDASVCAGCTLNFVAVAGAASSVGVGLGFNPLKFGVYLFRAIYRFYKGNQDKTNIPRGYELRLDQVVDAYQRYGGNIPEFCVLPLSQGFKCFQDVCSSKVADYVERKFGSFPTKVSWRNSPRAGGVAASHYKMAVVKMPNCDGSITVPFTCNERSGADWGVDKIHISAGGNCLPVIRRRP